jgi:AraC-like DNA-binding protein
VKIDFTTGNFFRMTNYVKHLGPRDGWVYIALASHADANTMDCYPSIKRMAREFGVSERTVKRSLKDLEAKNVIRIQRRSKDGAKDTNFYTILDPSVWRLDAVNEQSEPLAMPEPEPIPKSKPVKSERPVCLECGQRYFKGHDDTTGICAFCEDPRVRSGEISA